MTALVRRELTGGRNAAAWLRSRYAAALAEVTRLGLGATEAERAAVAWCAVCVWANETGYGDGSPGTTGEGESNFNVGSIHCGPATPTCVRVGDETLKAYPTLQRGVADFFSVVEHEYPSAWPFLRAGNLRYWDELQRNGYGGRVTAVDAVLIGNRVSAGVGLAPMTAAEVSELSAEWHVPDGDPEESGGGGGRSSASRWFLVAAALGLWVWKGG